MTPASSSAEVPPSLLHKPGPSLSHTPRALPSAHLSPVDGADTRHSVIVTDALGQQPVPDLPGKHGGVLALVVPDLLHHLGGGHLGLRATYHPRPDAASLVVPAPVGTQRPPSRQEALVPAEASGEGLGSVPPGWPQTLGGPALSPAWAGLCCCPARLRCCRPQPGCLVSPLPFPSFLPASCCECLQWGCYSMGPTRLPLRKGVLTSVLCESWDHCGGFLHPASLGHSVARNLFGCPGFAPPQEASRGGWASARLLVHLCSPSLHPCWTQGFL